jgi:hypothetical protein
LLFFSDDGYLSLVEGCSVEPWGHPADKVRKTVDEFLAARSAYPLMLKRKILMNVWEK